MKFNDTLLAAIRLDLETDQVPALLGEPGIGKSSFVEGLARDMDTKAFVLACNQLADKADLTGARLVPTPDGKSYHQEFYPHAVVQQAIEYARDNPREWPLLFLDEVNRTTSDVTSAVLTMVTMRQLGKEKLPSNLRLMIAGNTKGNVTTLDDASLSRFSLYNVEPDANTLIAVLGDAINPYVKAVLTEHPHLVFQKSRPAAFTMDDDDDDDTGTGQSAAFAELMDAGEEMRQLTAPRTIEGISRWLNAADPVLLQEWMTTATMIGDRQSTILNELIEGHLGDTDFTTFLVAKIAEGFASGSGATAAAQLSAPKPQCYDSLKQVNSMTDLEDLLATLTEHEKSGSLYAMYEKADNARLVEAIAQSLTAMEADHNRLLIQLASQSALDASNVDALTNATGNVADSARMLMSAFN